MTVVKREFYDVTRSEYRAAQHACRQVPIADRREAARLAKLGQPHPNPVVDATMQQWSRALLRRSGINRAPLWTVPVAGLALAVLGWSTGIGLIAIPGGIVATGLGLIGIKQRKMAREILAARR
jgi:hypothetical protein